MTVLKPLTVWITTNWKTLQEMGVPDHLTCLLRILYAGQEATVRTRNEQWTCSKLGKEYVKSVYCHPAYYLTCRVHHPAGLDEVQSRIRISRRNINNLRYADDTTNGRKQSGTKEPLESERRVKKLA